MVIIYITVLQIAGAFVFYIFSFSLDVVFLGNGTTGTSITKKVSPHSAESFTILDPLSIV